MYQEEIDAGGPLTVDKLVDVFVSLNIMAKYPNDEDEEDKLFMPALLNPAPSGSKQKHTEYGINVIKHCM